VIGGQEENESPSSRRSISPIIHLDHENRLRNLIMAALLPEKPAQGMSALMEGLLPLPSQ